MLLTMGVAGFIGTTLIGGFLKEGLYRTLITIPLLMAAIASALIAVSGGLAMTALLLGVWGLFATAAPVGWWTWVAETLPDDAEAGGGLMVAIVQVAITAGAVVGGLLFDMSGYKLTFAVSAVLLLAAAALALLTLRSKLADLG